MGQDLIRDQSIKFSFYRTLRKDFVLHDLIFKDTLYYSEAKVAPGYPGPDVKRCCRIRSDLRGINKNKMDERIGADGLIYYDITHDLVVSTAAANLKFSLEFDGVEMGSVEATYV